MKRRIRCSLPLFLALALTCCNGNTQEPADLQLETRNPNPETMSDLPETISDLPETISDLPETISDLPETILDPVEVSGSELETWNPELETVDTAADGEVSTCQPQCEGKECGDDGCGALCGPCMPPLLCEEGKCIEVGAAKDCKDQLYCMSLCEKEEVCRQQCILDGSPAGNAAYDALLECSLDQCQDLAALPSTFQLCLVDICGETWAQCLGGWGVLSCSAMLACIQNCGGPGQCEWNCLAAGSESGQDIFWALQACIQLNCADCQQELDCMQQCAQANCMNLLTQC